MSCQIRTGESVAGWWVKVGIHVFPRISNPFGGVAAIHIRANQE